MNDPITKAKADIEALDRKISALALEMEAIGNRRHQLTAERSRIQSFILMYDRYISETTGNKAEHPEHEPSSVVAKGGPVGQREGSTKPPGLPPKTKLIRDALLFAASIGEPALPPREIAKIIADQWWPTVRTDRITPVVWRMWKSGELTKDGEFYSLRDGA